MLTKNVPTTLTKVALIPVELIATASATEAAIQKKTYGLGISTLIISNEKKGDIREKVKHIGESGLLNIGVSKAITNRAKEQEDRFFCILLGTLGTRLLGSMLANKGIIIAGEVNIRAGKNF